MIDATATQPPVFETTPEEDVVLSFDTTALLIGGSSPTDPATALHPLINGGISRAVQLQDVPQVGPGNTITQRLRGLSGGTTYRLRISFATGGQRRAMTTRVVCAH